MGIESDSKFVLHSCFTRSEDYGHGYVNASEYLLAKSEYWVENGREERDWLVETTTGQSRRLSSFEGETRRIATGLIRRGFKERDTAVYMASDMVATLPFIVGVWRANGIVRAVYVEEDVGGLTNAMEESHVQWILCGPDTLNTCMAAAARMKWKVSVFCTETSSPSNLTGVETFEDLLQDGGDGDCKSTSTPPLALLQAKPNDIAVILSTSGTTGKSKGVCHTHSSVLSTLYAFSQMPFSSTNPNLFMVTSTHLGGLFFPLAMVATGCTGLVMRSSDKPNIFNAISKYKPEYMLAFTPIFTMLADEARDVGCDVSCIKIAFAIGAVLTAATETAIKSLPGVRMVINGYGITEIGAVAMNFNLNSGTSFHNAPPGTVGKLHPGLSLCVLSTSTSDHNENVTADKCKLQPLPTGIQGEIAIKSVWPHAVYYRNKSATEAAFVDGWFRTGDIGYFDENGFIFVIERRHDHINSYGNHIAPAELESVIAEHSAVGEVCVIGVMDPVGNDMVPRAYVTLRGGRSLNGASQQLQDSSSAKTADEIKTIADGKLAHYKRLRGGLFVVEELPKGKTGKMSRALVAEMDKELSG